MRYPIFVAVLLLNWHSPAFSLELDDYHLVDLSHTYSEDTLYWPTSPSAFEKTELEFGTGDAGYFYSAYSVCTPEHGGTHLDAPLHFAEDGVATDQIPLENLVGDAVIIDISEKTARERNYRLLPDDVIAFEERHGKIVPGAIVLLRTGWSHYWPDAMGYLGDDTPNDAGNLQFPGYGAEATRLLVESRGISILGIDTASIDYGPSQDFIAHRIAAQQGVINLENLTNLDELPATGAIVMALPMKIGGGSGGPARVIALVPQ